MVNNMEQHDFQQGSPEWHQHRATHFNASDAAAMLGISPYKTRSQLLHELHTGITPDIAEATQRRFDDGHRFEALARPLAEKIIGQRLFPVVGSEGKLSASFDGLTMDDSVCWEHKTLSASIPDPLTSETIPEHYRAQMEQQLMLSGAERCLFHATRFDGSGECAGEAYCWYVSNPDMRDRLLQGWTQLSIDLENYVPPVIAEMPKAEVKIELPALFVHAKGEITTHNMDEFGAALTAKLAEVRAIALVTDQDFSNAKEAAKKFRETAKTIALSKKAMLAQTETIGEAARKMDAWAKDLNATALQLEKDVEREDKAKKGVMILEGRQAYADHVAALETEIKPIRLSIAVPNFAEAIKGKRNYASMHDAVQTMLASAKMAADSQAKDIRAKLAWCKEHTAGHSALFPDLQALMAKPIEDFTLTITSRIEAHKKAEIERQEAQRHRIEAEAKAKAEAAALVELAASQERIRLEEQARARAEAAEKLRIAEMVIGASKLPNLPQERVKEIMQELAAQEKSRAKPNLSVVVPSNYVRPTDRELIESVAQNFNVTYGKACDWIIETATNMQEAA